MAETIHQKIENSPFKNIYWFSRHLLNTDQYGALGKNKEVQMLNTINSIECFMIQNSFTDEEKLSVCKSILIKEIKLMNTAKTKAAMLANNQEFERRLGQKRKARGGNSLETVVSFLFDYYKFPSTEAPSHFAQDLEVDKWYKCKDGWRIGISCKRTLRERWKQVSQADRGTLSHFKVKELWHVITFDKDLSDDKIVRLGEQGQIFYLMNNSEIYIRCSNHIGMKNYIRPLSNLISDIRTNITGRQET